MVFCTVFSWGIFLRCLINACLMHLLLMDWRWIVVAPTGVAPDCSRTDYFSSFLHHCSGIFSHSVCSHPAPARIGSPPVSSGSMSFLLRAAAHRSSYLCEFVALLQLCRSTYRFYVILYELFWHICDGGLNNALFLYQPK